MTQQFFHWIDRHITDDPAALRLRYSHRGADSNAGEIDYPLAITQIECRRKFAGKLRQTLAEAPQFIFPTVLAGEQATSDILAEYHASFVATGKPAADLTAGLGIDAMHAARRASSVDAVEVEENKTDALRHNAAVLGIHNLKVITDHCQHFIQQAIAEQRHYSTAFIDPARRDNSGARVFALTDCTPDVVALMPDIARITDRLIIKASPMLDATHIARTLPVPPTAIIAVGTSTECKELLIIVDFHTDKLHPAPAGSTPTLLQATTINADGTTHTFSYTATEETSAPTAPIAKPAPGEYILEPSPALMKLGPIRLIAQRYGLTMLQPNTRIYFSPSHPTDFPGRAYRIEEVLPYASKIIKRLARRYPVATVAVRNFGITADALRSKLGIRDGGTTRIYGLTDATGTRHLIIATPFQ